MTIDLRNRKTEAGQTVRVPDTRAVEEPAVVRRAHAAPRQRPERAITLGIYGIVALCVAAILIYGFSKAYTYVFAGEGTEREMRSLVSSVSDHMLLPPDETPTIATVSDMHALEGQLFFKNAQVGDKVLMYMVSQKAILYRPSSDLIIEVGPITGAE